MRQQEQTMKIQNPYWPRISPSLFYDDPGAAIDWLCRAFGFEVRLRVDGDNGYVVHSELLLGDGLIMVAGVQSSPDRQVRRKSPRSNDGFNTQSLMVHIEDAQAHCERARAAGAKILQEPKMSDYGEEYWADLCYEAEDPEGHRWWFAQRVRDHQAK
jgi:uncharacterized glyoxalase superfamily protein PhnB